MDEKRLTDTEVRKLLERASELDAERAHSLDVATVREKVVMTRAGVLGAALLLLSASTGAQVPVSRPAASPDSDSAAIASLEQRIEDAMVRRDVAFLDSTYAPTFRFKHSTGTLETRDARMASLRRDVPIDAAGRFIARTVDSLEVEVHGDVALTTGRIHVRRNGGDPRWRDYTVRYARIYVRNPASGQWQLLTHHSTGESQGPPAH